MMKCPTTTDNFKRPGKIYLQVNTLLARKGCRKLQDIFFEFRHYFFPSTISALAATNKVAAPERNFTIHKVFFVPSTGGQTNTSAEINLVNKPECQKNYQLLNCPQCWSGLDLTGSGSDTRAPVFKLISTRNDILLKD